MDIKIKSYAKINFFLKITGRDNRGYHLLDTVMSSIDLFDTIKINTRKDSNITLNCNGVEGENTAYQAAKLFMQKFKTNGFDIEIEKGIPLSAGLGGSSADSAGILFALGQIFNIKDTQLYNICKECGSDVLYMLSGGFARATGTGEIVEPFFCKHNYSIVVAKPNYGVSSAESYKMYDLLNEKENLNKAQDVITALQNQDYDIIKNCCYNSLYKASASILNDIKVVVDHLEGFNPQTVFMSGSGSACVAMFKENSQAKECEKTLSQKGFYAKAVTTMQKGIVII